MTPGTAAIVADVEEGWTTPVNTRFEAAGGTVYRFSRYDVEDDQLAREAAAINAELDELDAELEQAADDVKVSIQADIDATKQKWNETRDNIKTKLSDAKNEAVAKTDALKQQLTDANEKTRAKIEKRIADIKADYEIRTTKLGEAGRLAKDALA